VEDDPANAELIRQGFLFFEKLSRLAVTTTLACARDLITTKPPVRLFLATSNTKVISFSTGN
jgi:hypothetical protein